MSKKIYLILIIIIGVVSVAGYLAYNRSGVNPVYRACLDSGGRVVKTGCCKETKDFPNQCQIGACGCSPQNSHQVKACECGIGCFNGEKCVKRDGASKNNFEKEGYLVKFGQEEKWALKYEEVGEPALVLTLKFNGKSNCDLVEGEKPCSEFEGDYGEVGDRVKVIGNKKENTVVVDKLIYVK